MKKLIICLTLVLIAGAGSWFVWRPAQAAPDVSFTTLSGQKVSMDQLRGKVVLVKFWATDCPTCVQQMPTAIQTYDKFAPKGFETVAVAMAYDPPNYVTNYVESRKLPFMVTLDHNGELAKAFGNVQLTPTAFLIDRQGHIIKRYLGNFDENTFQATLEHALSAG